MSGLNITVAGTGYVGLSIATLLAQHNYVVAVDTDLSSLKDALDKVYIRDLFYCD